MTTRFNSKSQTVKGVAGVQSGYEALTSSEVTVPSNGLTDIDRALFKLFKDELNLQVSDGAETKKVSTVFAAGEKWAQMKKNSPLRDKTGALILPLTTIVRTGIKQRYDEDIAGRGSNQHVGEIVVKRVLSRSDRGLQSILNERLGVDQFGELHPEENLFANDRRKNITEVIVVPTPQYVTVSYEITFWTMYMQQMNQIIENVVSSYLPQTRGYRLEAENGYYFYAYVTSDAFDSEGNETDVAGSERIIRTKMEIDVPAFILASDTPGAPVPVRRYISNPSVTFEIQMEHQQTYEPDFVEEPFIGSDDPTLPMGTREDRKDLRKTYPVHGRVLPDSVIERDPALMGRKRGEKLAKWRRVTLVDASGVTSQRLVRVKTQNVHTGELILDTSSLAGLTIVSVDD